MKNPSSNPIKKTESGDFDSENAYRKPPEAACDMLILVHFPCSQ
jgi:hypothetical protein